MKRRRRPARRITRPASRRSKIAGYGLAGLIARAVIAKKIGLVAAILLFGKQFLVIILAGVVAAGAWLKKRFATGADK